MILFVNLAFFVIPILLGLIAWQLRQILRAVKSPRPTTLVNNYAITSDKGKISPESQQQIASRVSASMAGTLKNLHDKAERKRASGGPVPSGTNYIVGEGGPEAFIHKDGEKGQ